MTQPIEYDLDALEDAASAAIEHGGDNWYESDDVIEPMLNCPDADFIRACYPAVVADLVKRVRRAEANEIPLNIIRNWPEGFQSRLELVWRDLIGFIPNYKLYDLQCVLAEFGFTMKVFDATAADSEGEKG